MPYMGIQELKDANVKSGSATGDGSTTTFAIGWTPPSAGSLFVTINGVLQSASAYSISVSNCVFTAAPASADAIEFKGIQSSGTVVTLGDGVVNAAQLGSSSVVTASIVDNTVTLAKMAGLARGKIIVGDASGDPSALTVGTANQVLKSDGTDVAWGADAGGIAASEMKGFTKRPVFEWLSTTTMGLQGDFLYQHNGTTTQIVGGSNITFTRSDTSGTEQWNYLYLDDSAIVTAGNSTITASELISSPTAPTLNVTKGGFYNGNDRCIYTWKQNASDEILRFSKIQQMGAAVGTVVNDFSWTFENSSGAAYGTGWHSYTATTDYLPRPCGVAGLAMGAFINLGGSHASMYVTDDIGTEYDMFNVAAGANTNTPVTSAGLFKVRLDYAHSSYTQLFKLIGWVPSPLL